MFWVIRGTDARTDEDFALVVEAPSRAGAETWALKRNIPYIVIDDATDADVADARKNKRLWKHTPESHYTCFGQPVTAGHLACLMLCGVWTMLLLLRQSNAGLL